MREKDEKINEKEKREIKAGQKEKKNNSDRKKKKISVDKRQFNPIRKSFSSKIKRVINPW